MPETFITNKVNVENDYNCPICWDNKDKYFIVHSGQDGKKHPVHFECVKQWLNEGKKNCPSCQVEISKQLISNAEYLKHFAHKSKTGALAGFQSISYDYVYGIAAAICIAGLIFAGEKGFLSTLSHAGTGIFASGFIGGIVGPFFPNIALQSEMEIFGSIVGGFSTVASTVYSLFKPVNALWPPQLIALFAFSKAAGAKATANGTALGAAVATLGSVFFNPENWGKMIARFSGGMGAFLGETKSQKTITVASFLAGWRAASIEFDKLAGLGPVGSTLASAAIGACISAIAKTILVRAFTQFDREYLEAAQLDS